jgi:hypothetical protein
MVVQGFPSLDRRRFLAGAGTGFLIACSKSSPAALAGWASPHPLSCDFGDVHTHFFNLSDLPARGFLQLVLIPNRFPNLPGILVALADLLVRAGKLYAPSIARERQRQYCRSVASSDGQVSADTVAKFMADRLRRRSSAGLRKSGSPGAILAAAPTDDLDQSYLALVQLLNELDVRKSGGQGVGLDGPDLDVDPDFLRSMLEGNEAFVRKADPAASAVPDEPFARCKTEPAACPGEACEQEVSLPPDLQKLEIPAILRWAYEMLLPRCVHVRDYLSRTRHLEFRPRLLVHHLVDYDRWIGDGPRGRSSHAAQISFWTDYADQAKPTLELHSFAGYDPLKHAEQRLRGSTPWFNTLAEYYRNQRHQRPGRRISGFKLYPPMGFKPLGNLACDFAGTERARGIVGRRWRRERALRERDLGAELDKSLREFYRFCVEERAPILSHAIPGNQAACCFGQRANPKHWIPVLEKREFAQLRLCLGHIVNSGRCFIDGVKVWRAHRCPEKRNQLVPPQVWTLHGTAELLRRSTAGEMDVYADIGYLSEVLDPAEGEGFSADFFRALKFYCDEVDPGCRRIMFGSDWIMIGHEGHYETYTSRILGGMEAAGWPDDWKANFMSENLKRFLGTTGPATAGARPAPCPAAPAA